MESEFVRLRELAAQSRSAHSGSFHESVQTLSAEGREGFTAFVGHFWAKQLVTLCRGNCQECACFRARFAFKALR